MTVYVDNADIRTEPGEVTRRAARWSHMWADTQDELHAFAERLGLKRSWFQGPPEHRLWHYDVTATVRRQAVCLGATEVEAGDLSTHPASRQYQRKREAEVTSEPISQPEAPLV